LTRLGFPLEAEGYYTAAAPRLSGAELHTRAQAFLQQGNAQWAANVLVEILRRWPEDPRALRNLACIRFVQGRVPEAVGLAMHLTKIPSDAARGYALLGTMYLHLGNFRDTVECYREVLRLDPELEAVPDAFEFLKTLAMSLHQLGQVEEAESYYQRALSVRHEAEALRFLGLLRSEDGDAESAERYWRAALEEDPRYVPALTDLGSLALRSGETDEAIALFEQAVEFDRYSRTAHYGLGLAYERSGQAELAKKEFAEAEKLQQ
jgi:tetratricopeptide (TPR) repeat protein